MRKTYIIAFVILTTLAGCQTIREVLNLRKVDFALDSVSNAYLAGVDLSRVRSYNDVSAVDVVRLGRAIAVGELPFEFVLHVGAKNPAENNVQARLVQMDWTLFLEDRETISGTFNDDVVLPAGQEADIPIRITLDLVDFFDRNAQDLFELALAVSGQGGAPKEIRLQATPTISTPLGDMRYPQPITIVSREVGS